MRTLPIVITSAVCVAILTAAPVATAATVTHAPYALGTAKQCDIGYVKVAASRTVTVEHKKVTRHYTSCAWNPSVALKSLRTSCGIGEIAILLGGNVGLVNWPTSCIRELY